MQTQKPQPHLASAAQPAAYVPLPPAPAPGSIPAWARRKNGRVLPPHDEHATPATPPPQGLYVALGDNITWGVGASVNCQAFPAHPVDIGAYCPDGTSYPVMVAKALRSAGIAGRFMNLGIMGASVERVMSDEIPYLRSDAKLVTLYVGTNDSRAVRFPNTTVTQVVNKFEKHYNELLAMIHEKAPHARIVLVNFPNQKFLADSYRASDEVQPLYNAASQILAQFIDHHYPQYAVVDTICNTASYDYGLLSNGTVDPNDTGDMILAQRIVKVIAARNPPAPPSSCVWYDEGTAATLKSTAE
ncbi:MAG: SGNH/GDSL hydrolase family protein [Terracidiphilus sp.]